METGSAAGPVGTAIENTASQTGPEAVPGTRSRQASQATARPARRRTLASIFYREQQEELDIDSAAATAELHARLPQILSDCQHSEMFGVPLQPPHIETAADVPTLIVLNKFLRANDNRLDDADAQLRMALFWRREMQPLALANNAFSRDKYDHLGCITKHPSAVDGLDVTVTWNTYGAVRNAKAVCRDVTDFIRYRVALMELSIQQLGIDHATELPEGRDPYKMVQIHDYQGVNMLLFDAATRNATREVIRVFTANYPELLRQQFLVNVPMFMPVIVTVVQGILQSTGNTRKKLRTLRRGAGLHAALPDIGATLPVEYGGQGPSMRDVQGLTVRFDEGAIAQPVDSAAKIPENAVPILPRDLSEVPAQSASHNVCTGNAAASASSPSQVAMGKTVEVLSGVAGGKEDIVRFAPAA